MEDVSNNDDDTDTSEFRSCNKVYENFVGLFNSDADNIMSVTAVGGGEISETSLLFKFY